jgi:hypothetical protein
MSSSKNHARAVRYRQLALAEADRSKADLLYKLADEAERNVQCTSDWMQDRRPEGVRPPNEKPWP